MSKQKTFWSVAHTGASSFELISMNSENFFVQVVSVELHSVQEIVRLLFDILNCLTSE